MVHEIVPAIVKQKVSLEHKIPKIWFSEPDTETKIGSESGLTKPVSRYVLTLLTLNKLLSLNNLSPNSTA